MMNNVINLRNLVSGFSVLFLLVTIACGAPTEQEESTAPAGDSQPTAPQQEQPAAQPTLAQPSGMSDSSAGGAAPTAISAPTDPPSTTAGEPVQADLRVAITPPYAENLLGWRVGGTNQGILQPMQENLIQRNFQTWEAQEMLATSWSVSPDGKVWNIKLREDVPFHHGEDTFGVSDFVFSFQLWSHPESRAGFGPLWNTLLGPGDDKYSWDVDELGKTNAVEEVSDSEMILRLNRPELWIPFFASDATTDPIIYSLDYWQKHGEAVYAEHPVGTGPWQHINYEQGAKLEYERVPYEHWRITPDFESLTFFFAEEDSDARCHASQRRSRHSRDSTRIAG